MLQAWQPAVEGAVGEYLNAAQTSFNKGDSLEGEEIMTDAVRGMLGYIAAPVICPTMTAVTSTESSQPWAFGSGCPPEDEGIRPGTGQHVGIRRAPGPHLRRQLGTASKRQVWNLRQKRGRRREEQVQLHHTRDRTGHRLPHNPRKNTSAWLKD